MLESQSEQLIRSAVTARCRMALVLRRYVAMRSVHAHVARLVVRLGDARRRQLREALPVLLHKRAVCTRARKSCLVTVDGNNPSAPLATRDDLL